MGTMVNAIFCVFTRGKKILLYSRKRPTWGAFVVNLLCTRSGATTLRLGALA